MKLVFSTQKYQYLRDELCQFPDFEKGDILTKTFPDGEYYYKIENEVQNREVILIGGTVSEKDTLEIYDLACGLVGYGIKKLQIIIPFYGYSTMERAVKHGEIVTAKTRARLLSSIPPAYFGNQIILVDLHVPGLQHYFEGTVQRLHLYAKPLIIEAARELSDDFVLASTDAGRAKWVESLANDMGVDAAFVYKRRSSGSHTEITGINADVKDRTVIMYDDMIRTGGSLINAAKAYKDAGAKDVYVIATHGVFPNNAIKRIQDSGLIKQIVVTNSHPNTLRDASDFLKVKSIISILHKALKRG